MNDDAEKHLNLERQDAQIHKNLREVHYSTKIDDEDAGTEEWGPYR